MPSLHSCLCRASITELAFIPLDAESKDVCSHLNELRDSRYVVKLSETSLGNTGGAADEQHVEM